MLIFLYHYTTTSATAHTINHTPIRHQAESPESNTIHNTGTIRNTHDKKKNENTNDAKKKRSSIKHGEKRAKRKVQKDTKKEDTREREKGLKKITKKVITA